MSRLHPFLLLSCLVPAVVLASFPIEVEINAGDNTAECEGTFVSGPERPFPRRTILEPGESTVMTQPFERAITKVRVTLNCKPK